MIIAILRNFRTNESDDDTLWLISYASAYSLAVSCYLISQKTAVSFSILVLILGMS